MKEAETEVVRKPTHAINPESDLDLHIHTSEGELIRLDSFRTYEEQQRVIGRLSYTGGETSEYAGEEVLMPENLEVSKSNRFDFVRRNKGAYKTIGSMVIIVAASTGILIRRHRGNK